eukprot:4732772-Pleurochrysis_carterae.AAC.1
MPCAIPRIRRPCFERGLALTVRSQSTSVFQSAPYAAPAPASTAPAHTLFPFSSRLDSSASACARQGETSRMQQKSKQQANQNGGCNDIRNINRDRQPRAKSFSRNAFPSTLIPPASYLLLLSSMPVLGRRSCERCSHSARPKPPKPELRQWFVQSRRAHSLYTT